jgi:nucleotide-binding universal stress UspA family protein
MSAIRSILHPTDFSPPADAALMFALALARDQKAKLTLVHVARWPARPIGMPPESPPPLDTDLERRELERQLRQRPTGGFPVDHRLEYADTFAEGIIHVAKELGCDLIVMGTHGRTGLSRLLLGSVAEEIVRRAPCPVLTVRSSLVEEDRETTEG